jgi:hypothetical protein
MKAFYEPAPPTSELPKMPDTYRPEEYNPEPVRPLKSSRSNPTIGLRRNIGPSSGVRSRTLPGPRPTTAGGDKPLAQPMVARFETAEPMPAPVIESYSVGNYMDDEAAVPPPLAPYRPQASHTEEELQDPAYAPAIPPRSTRRKPPSPPASITTSDDVDNQSFVESPIVPYAFRDMSPQGSSPHRGVPSSLVPGGLRQLMGDDYMAYEPTASLPIIPYSVPTPPPSLPRASGENSSRPSLSEFDDTIVIQTVGAMKGTTTKNTSMRRSVEPSVEAERMENESAHLDEQHSPMFQDHRGDLDHRPALKLDTQPISRSTTPDRATPRNAPFSKPPRSASPFGGSPLNPARSGVPAGAVGARGRPLRPVIATPQRVIPEGIPVAVRPVSMDSCQDDEDDDDDDEPEEPDSPLLPLTGPLASPMVLPPEEPPARPPMSRNGSDRDYSVTTNFKGVSQIPNRAATMPESNSKPAAPEKVTWPFLSSGSAIPESSSSAPPSRTMTPPVRTQSPFSMADSSSTILPLRTMTPPVRTQSPYSMPDTWMAPPPSRILSPPIRSQSPLSNAEFASMTQPAHTMTPPVRTQSPYSMPESSAATPVRTMTPPVRTQSPYSMPDSSMAPPPSRIMSPPIRSQSTLSNAEFASMTPPVRTMTPPVRSQSPLSMPSFSRPYTPTSNTRPGMPAQQQDYPTNMQPPAPNNMRLRGPSPVRRGGAPPPRRTGTDYGMGRPMPETLDRSGSTFI